MQPKVQFTVLGAHVSNVTLVIIGAALVFALLTDIVINRTKFGRGIRAVAGPDDGHADGGVAGTSDHDDIPHRRTARRGGGAALHPEGAAGNHLSGGFLLGIRHSPPPSLGGIRNLRGAPLGGLILGVMENYGQMLFGAQWRDVVAFVLLVLVLLIRPHRHPG